MNTKRRPVVALRQRPLAAALFEVVMTDKLPGKGLWGWLGRQMGYVRAASKTDVASEKVYKQKRVEEQPHPHDPEVTLRRTTIDEAVRKPPDAKA